MRRKKEEKKKKHATQNKWKKTCKFNYDPFNQPTTNIYDHYIISTRLLSIAYIIDELNSLQSSAKKSKNNFALESQHAIK